MLTCVFMYCCVQAGLRIFRKRYLIHIPKTNPLGIPIHITIHRPRMSFFRFNPFLGSVILFSLSHMDQGPGLLNELGSWIT